MSMEVAIGGCCTLPNGLMAEDLHCICVKPTRCLQEARPRAVGEDVRQRARLGNPSRWALTELARLQQRTQVAKQGRKIAAKLLNAGWTRSEWLHQLVESPWQGSTIQAAPG